MAIKKSGTHSISFEGTTLDVFYNSYLPSSDKIFGSIIVLHGMQEHSGRYDEFATFLSKNGFAVLTYDHPGHGQTAKDKEELGFFHESKPGEFLIQVAIGMSKFLNSQYKDQPHFIIGHSLGSFISRNVIQEIGEEFRGAVLIGSGHAMKGSSLGTKFLGVLNRVAPNSRSSFMNDKFAQINNRKFKDEPNHEDLNWLSLNLENRDNYLTDEYCGIDFTDNAFYGAAQVTLWGSGNGWVKKIPKELSVLFLSGEDDPIGDFGKGVKKSAEELVEHGSKDVKYQLYPKMRHELLNEDVKKDVYQKILDWLLIKI
ncbi:MULTISPECIES: alpha/beta fold hydrolase [unclassified Sphingobacterium]|uniref:alpha/beta fold hydrolase n=1 Tax=unclassified Sphingobacterium TaxID=2609468 RepID=UPI0020C35F53|nr:MULTISPECIES: alpha/beta hydrolase [unclassified Sphingobacterium]